MENQAPIRFVSEPFRGTMTKQDAQFARMWRGRVAREKADAYQAYWLAQGVEPLKALGATEVYMMRDDGVSESEFVTVSYWRSLAGMTGRRGGDPVLAHHLPRDSEFLIDLPERVQILRILAS